MYDFVYVKENGWWGDQFDGNNGDKEAKNSGDAQSVERSHYFHRAGHLEGRYSGYPAPALYLGYSFVYNFLLI